MPGPDTQQQYGTAVPAGQGHPQTGAYGQAWSQNQGGNAPWMVRTPVLAGFWWRVLAAILDSLLVSIPFGLIVSLVARGPIAELTMWWEDAFTRALQGDPTQPPLPQGALFAITALVVVLWIIYRTVMVALRGGTLGQLITGLRVVPDGSPSDTIPGWGTSSLRAIVAVILQQLPLVGLIDVLVMLFTAKKQTVHDMIARTVVIKK